MKVLVIDDEAAVGNAIKAMLAPRKWEVDSMQSAEEAVNLVADGGYDFILLDYKMPDKDGIWFMRNAQIPRETKTLLMTAYVNRRVINEMFKLGAVGYVMKPFDQTELLKHLEFHVNNDVADEPAEL